MRHISTISAFLFVAVLSAGLFTVPLHAGDSREEHPAQHSQQPAHPAPLTEPGNSAYSAVQEVVERLREDPETDWSEVDLEALRQHLADMNNFTLEAELVERDEIEGGLRVEVTGDTPEVRESVRRALTAHAPMLERELGWEAEAETLEDSAVLTVTSDEPREVEEIRGLGYIGLMASGAHHQRHHWMIATGDAPH